MDTNLDRARKQQQEAEANKKAAKLNKKITKLVEKGSLERFLNREKDGKKTGFVMDLMVNTINVGNPDKRITADSSTSKSALISRFKETIARGRLSDALKNKTQDGADLRRGWDNASEEIEKYNKGALRIKKVASVIGAGFIAGFAGLVAYDNWGHKLPDNNGFSIGERFNNAVTGSDKAGARLYMLTRDVEAVREGNWPSVHLEQNTCVRALPDEGSSVSSTDTSRRARNSRRDAVNNEAREERVRRITSPNTPPQTDSFLQGAWTEVSLGASSGNDIRAQVPTSALTASKNMKGCIVH